MDVAAESPVVSWCVVGSVQQNRERGRIEVSPGHSRRNTELRGKFVKQEKVFLKLTSDYRQLSFFVALFIAVE